MGWIVIDSMRELFGWQWSQWSKSFETCNCFWSGAFLNYPKFCLNKAWVVHQVPGQPFRRKQKTDCAAGWSVFRWSSVPFFLLIILTWMLAKCKFVLFPSKDSLKLLPSSSFLHPANGLLSLFNGKAMLSHLMISLHVNFKLKTAATIKGAHAACCRLQRPVVESVEACQAC